MTIVRSRLSTEAARLVAGGRMHSSFSSSHYSDNRVVAVVEEQACSPGDAASAPLIALVALVSCSQAVSIHSSMGRVTQVDHIIVLMFEPQLARPASHCHCYDGRAV